VVVLGTLAFAALGLFLAGVLRAEATLAAANLVYLLLMAGGAVVLPDVAYGAFGHVAGVAALGCARQRAAQRAGRRQPQPARGAVLVVWSLVGAVLTARTFSWE
jgi:ABC-2 type transport system permease protein